MREKIVEIKEKYTLLKGVVVENESDTHTVWLVVGNQQFVLEGYHSIEEGEWMREMLAKAILALIASEQKPMVEALKLSRKHIGHLLQNPDKYKKTGETHIVLAKIASVLEGKGK